MAYMTAGKTAMLNMLIRDVARENRLARSTMCIHRGKSDFPSTARMNNAAESVDVAKAIPSRLAEQSWYSASGVMNSATTNSGTG